jgi:hypothetical protein
MPVRYRPDALSLHVNEIRKMLPGRKIAHLICPQCGRRCQMMFLHPADPSAWACKVCQRFTVGRNGQYALSELARARNVLDRIARERRQQTAGQEGEGTAKRRRTRTEASRE